MENKESYPLDTSGEDWFRNLGQNLGDNWDSDRANAAQADLTRYGFKLVRGKRPRKQPRTHIPLPGEVIGGRTYHLAVCPAVMYPRDKEWVFRDLLLQATRVLERLNYRQSMAICNALGWRYSTFKARRSRYRRVRLWEAFVIVDWSLRGKPIVRKRQLCKDSLEEVSSKVDKSLTTMREQRGQRQGHPRALYDSLLSYGE